MELGSLKKLPKLKTVNSVFGWVKKGDKEFEEISLANPIDIKVKKILDCKESPFKEYAKSESPEHIPTFSYHPA